MTNDLMVWLDGENDPRTGDGSEMEDEATMARRMGRADFLRGNSDANAYRGASAEWTRAYLGGYEADAACTCIDGGRPYGPDPLCPRCGE